MSHQESSLWLNEIPELSAMYFESGGIKYVDFKAKIGGYPNDIGAHVSIVFSTTAQINEFIDVLEDARLLLSGGATV